MAYTHKRTHTHMHTLTHIYTCNIYTQHTQRMHTHAEWVLNYYIIDIIVTISLARYNIATVTQFLKAS